ncbi:MAG: cell division protein FtsK [Parcubacteria group bacterium]|nr:cell division protein FtsK [Parcubacteria group bacterium]
MAKKKKKSNASGPVGNGKNRNGKGKKSVQPKNRKAKFQKEKTPIVTSRVKRWIGAVFMMVIGAIVVFSFFDRAGSGGEGFLNVLRSIVGNTAYATPFLFVLGGFILIKPQKKRVVAPMLVSTIFLAMGISGILASRDIGAMNGGWVGKIVSWPILTYFGLSVSFVVFSAFVLIGVLVSWDFLPKGEKKPKPLKMEKDVETIDEKEAIIDPVVEKKPKLEIKSIDLPKKKSIFSAITKPLTPKKEEEPKQKPLEAPSKSIGNDGYNRPPIELFDIKEEKASSGDTNYNAAIIQKTFANFGISVEMAEINTGPTVAQYTLKPAEGVKLSKITTLNNDLALSLAAHPIRIEAPIPGKSLVGVEVPNKIKAKVKLGTIMARNEFQTVAGHLVMGLGLDVMGNAMLADLNRMPHLLVAGATGSGKTICLNSLIVSLIARNSPKRLRFILIDPKRVEFPVYRELPHLLTPVILNARKAVNALNWLVGEMERRFDVLSQFGARDIRTYNDDLEKKPKKKEKGFEELPYIVVIVDELADLMMAKGKEVEASVVRLSQLARAVGIHLILATQRPSVEVITGLIKANITSRIAFQVASQIDSRTILDCSGAEKLLGKGDMLFLSSEFSRPKRIQGSFVSSPEIKKAVDFINKENIAEVMEDLEEKEQEDGEPRDGVARTGNGKANEGDIVNFSAPDELYDEAKEIVLQYQKASASLLQRRLQVGYARAARILDMLEENGVVGSADGSKPRDILTQATSDETQPDKDGFQDPSDLEFEQS